MRAAEQAVAEAEHYINAGVSAYAFGMPFTRALEAALFLFDATSFAEFLSKGQNRLGL